MNLPRSSRRWAAALGISLLVLVGCSSVQTTQPGAIGLDRTQRMSSLVSEADLRKSAVQAYNETLSKERQKGALNPNPAMTARVRAIAQRIIPQTGVFRPDAPSWQWEVNVIQSPEVNAWCMPGGKIAFYSGLIEKMALTDDEIAAVMGHEIAHALREHARERASERAVSGLAIGVAVAVLGAPPGTGDLANTAYSVTFGLPHSRLHETEADRVGVELAARAGYDPRAAITLWQKMGKGAGKTPELLSTHPSPESRIQDLEVYAARVLPLYEQARKSR